jgi:hypothetical protein
MFCKNSTSLVYGRASLCVPALSDSFSVSDVSCTGVPHCVFLRCQTVSACLMSSIGVIQTRQLSFNSDERRVACRKKQGRVCGSERNVFWIKPYVLCT